MAASQHAEGHSCGRYRWHCAAGLLVSEGMAYAGIAGVPPQMGLYAAMAGMFAYALFGTSLQLAVTSTSSSAAMLAALVAPVAVGDSARYVVLVSGAAIAAGVSCGELRRHLALARQTEPCLRVVTPELG